MSQTPSQEQIEALKKFAKENGRSWKSKLMGDWMNGRCEGYLQQVRNQLGPMWLQKFKLPKD